MEPLRKGGKADVRAARTPEPWRFTQYQRLPIILVQRKRKRHTWRLFTPGHRAHTDLSRVGKHHNEHCLEREIRMVHHSLAPVAVMYASAIAPPTVIEYNS